MLDSFIVLLVASVLVAAKLLAVLYAVFCKSRHGKLFEDKPDDEDELWW